jgi:hypothetical protein
VRWEGVSRLGVWRAGNGEGEAEVLVRAGLRNGLGWRGGRFIDGTSKGTEQE